MKGIFGPVMGSGIPTMHGNFDPLLLYGVLESNRDRIVRRDWLQTYFPSLDTFASDVARTYMGSAIYGIPVYLDPATGAATVNADDKAVVQVLYDTICTYYRAQGATQNDLPEVGYFLALTGDFECEHEEYVPDCAVKM